MGIAGDFLPRVLEATGRIVDLKDYRDGVWLPESAPGKRRRRPMRIGIDVSSWIYRAGYAFGDMLMHDDRHLTTYGRANLQREHANEPHNHELSTHEVKQAEKIRNYCEVCANYVVRRLELLKDGSGADLLVVFDGRTPPIKTATVTHRKETRQAYSNIRDNIHALGGNTSNNNDDALDFEIDVEQRERANRRAGPGEHVGRIVEKVMEKLRQRAKNASSNSKAQGASGNSEPTNGKEVKNNPSQTSNANANNKDGCLAAWMVAPYEADSQLAYLSKQSYVDLVITEDTDLIAHGCRSVMYKCLENNLDTDKDGSSSQDQSGENPSTTAEVNIDITRGKLVEFHDLGGTRVFPPRGTNANSRPVPDLSDFTPIMMAVLFVLLGCDYNGHRKLKGIGLLKACRIVRKAFLGGPSTVTTTTTEESSSQSQANGTRPMIPFSPEQPAAPRTYSIRSKQMSCLDTIWKEAYEQSYDSSNVYTNEFKRDYQKSFVEALWMYRHPIVFDPLIKVCIPWNDSTNCDRMGDPELLEGCQEYSELSADPIRIQQVVGELPPTQQECISIAEGRSHIQWKLKKPTPIYSTKIVESEPSSTRNGDPTVAGRRRRNNSSAQRRHSNNALANNNNNFSIGRRRRRKTPSPNVNGNNHDKKPRKDVPGESFSPESGFSSTQSDRRRSLDGDEIAAVAAGGIKKDDRRPSSLEQNHQCPDTLSRQLFSNPEEVAKKSNPMPSPPSLGQPSPGTHSHESPSNDSDKTIPMSADSRKSQSFYDATATAESNDTVQSPNLLASTTTTSLDLLASTTTTTPIHKGGGNASTQSSSKATTLSLSESAKDTSAGASGTQSSSKATTQTISQTPSSAGKSVNLLASSTTSTHSHGLATSQSQTPHFSTQEDLSTELFNDSNADDNETHMGTQMETHIETQVEALSETQAEETQATALFATQEEQSPESFAARSRRRSSPRIKAREDQGKLRSGKRWGGQHASGFLP